MEIYAKNVHAAMRDAGDLLLRRGIKTESRNGAVIRLDEPIMIHYLNPRQHVMLSDTRDANPIFHMMEALWMLAGRNDLAWPLQFNKRFSEYSDDGVTLAGAYGWRWRQYFGRDQLVLAINELRGNPGSRRVVVSMWSENDLRRRGKDLPCNTHIYFDIVDGKLNMMVCNRSNDAIWGAFGANVVHMSMLMEFMAHAIGVDMGRYTQMSNNLHFYTDVYDEARLARIVSECNSLADDHQERRAMCSVPQHRWEQDLMFFLSDPMRQGCADPFFTNTIQPMFKTWSQNRAGNKDKALKAARAIADESWRIATEGWLSRRKK